MTASDTQGKLYVKFDIDFPDNGMVSPEARALLVKVFRTIAAFPFLFSEI